MKHLVRHITLLLLLFSAVAVCAQKKKKDMVYLEHCETLNFDEQRLPNAQILKGNVQFRHDSALMFCDSAYFYDKENSLDAFGHVRMEQGDTLFGYADKMFYDGNNKFVRFRQNVKMIHRNDVLTTDSLNYNRLADLAYYFSGGTLRDSLNTLTSVWGQYNPTTSQAQFNDEVVLSNPNFVLRSDTLDYNTESKIANIVGPTTIVYDQETTIRSTRGWYNTATEKSMLLERSSLTHTDGMVMIGDTIYYDKLNGYGQVLTNMEMRDSSNHMTLYGDYGEMYEEGHRGYATKKALMVDWSDSTNYAYLHADTLFTEEIQSDSIEPYRRMRAYYNCRFYRSDLQAICDSLAYNGQDSTLTLYQEPRCWNANNQMSADSIIIYIINNELDHIHGMGNALVAQEEQKNTKYNQMGGKEILCHVEQGEMRQVDVSGNAETIFYPKDEGKDSDPNNPDYVGMNRTMSSFVKIFIENQDIHHVLFTTETTGNIYPLDQIPAGEDKLSGFFWADVERPKKPADVLDPTQRLERPDVIIKSAVDAIEEDDKAVQRRKKRDQQLKDRNQMRR